MRAALFRVRVIEARCGNILRARGANISPRIPYRDNRRAPCLGTRTPLQLRTRSGTNYS